MSVGCSLCLGRDPSPATLPSYAVSHNGDRAKLLQRIVVEASLFLPNAPYSWESALRKESVVLESE